MACILLLLCVLFETSKVVTGIIYFDSSDYKIINDIQKCGDLGDEWDRAILDKDYEVDFLHISFRQSCEGYQIGGSTNLTGVSYVDLEDYLPDNSGVNGINIWLGCADSLYGLVLDGDGFHPSNQIVCEKRNKRLYALVNSKREFASPQSTYRILSNSTSHNYAYWSSKCQDLGEGWAPAILNNEEELKFIRQGQKTNIMTGRYWIGGSTNASKDSTIGYSDYYTTGSGSYNVIINPGNRREMTFRVKSKAASNKAPGILCEKEIVKAVYTGHEIASPTNRYRKLIATYEYGISYRRGVQYCSAMGNGWKIAVLDTQEEYEFIREAQRSFNSSTPYWIGGSANATLNEFFNYTDYIASSANSSDQYSVVVSTHYTVGGGDVAVFFDKNTYNLWLRSQEYVVPAVLCEQEIHITGLEFASAESYYKKIVGSAHDYSYYASKCRELGEGWGPTVLETELEHDFIRQSQKGLSDAQDYFTAGSRYPEQTGHFPYHVSVRFSLNYPVTEILYSTNQSVYPVFVTTYDKNLQQHNNNQFALVSALPNATTLGILCEKAVA